jgi:hypothetical protein
LKASLHKTKENGVAEIKKTKIFVRINRTIFPIMYHVMSQNISSISGHVVIERHKMFVITIRKRLVPTKDTTGIASLLQANSAPKTMESHQ